MKPQPMLTLCGTVLRLYEQPQGIDKKTGEAFGGGTKVQILADIPLVNGAFRADLVTLATDQPETFQALMGRVVRVPVGVYAMRGAVGYFCLRGAAPELLEGVTP